MPLHVIVGVVHWIFLIFQQKLWNTFIASTWRRYSLSWTIRLIFTQYSQCEIIRSNCGWCAMSPRTLHMDPGVWGAFKFQWRRYKRKRKNSVRIKHLQGVRCPLRFNPWMQAFTHERWIYAPDVPLGGMRIGWNDSGLFRSFIRTYQQSEATWSTWSHILVFPASLHIKTRSCWTSPKNLFKNGRFEEGPDILKSLWRLGWASGSGLTF